MKQTDEFNVQGFATLECIYTPEEVDNILQQISHANTNRETFRISSDLFAIRQFLKEIPGVLDILYNASSP